MYSILSTEVLKAKDINATAKLAYSAIVSHYRGEGSQMFPSYNRIAELMGVCRMTAIRAVKSLVNAGYITKQPQFNQFNNGYNSNIYTLVTNLLPPSNNTVTNPSNNTVTNPSNNIVTSKNSNIENKNFKLSSRVHAREEQEEGTENNNRKQTLTARLQLLGNNTEWLEVVELYGKAYLRFSSPISHKYTDVHTIRTATAFLSDLGIVSEPEILKHNQYRAEGVLM